MKKFDVVFVSYDEPWADALFNRAQDMLGCQVKRLHGVRGVARSYQLTASMVDTSWYLLLDGDCELHESFNPRAELSRVGDSNVIVWRSRNPVNGLEYGYGGPKLCRAETMAHIRSLSQSDPLAGTPGLRFLGVVGCTTHFNQTPFLAWRSAFREVRSLCRGDFGFDSSETQRLVSTWTTVTLDAPNAEWALRGASDAKASVATGSSDLGNVDTLDVDALRAVFERLYPASGLDISHGQART